MEQSKVNEFLQKKGKSFPKAKQEEIKQKLDETPDSKYDEIIKAGFKNSGSMTVMALLFPGFGIDRFGLGNAGLGILRIVSFLVYVFLYFLLTRYDDIAPLPLLLLPWTTFFLYIGASITFPVGNLGILALLGGLIIFIWYAVELGTAGKRAKNFNHRKLHAILL